MTKLRTALMIAVICWPLPKAMSQPAQSQLGAWYMYFFNTSFKDSDWGVQGDVQFRNWNLGGDLEQLLLRGGLTYVPKTAKAKFTLGYGNVTTGAFGSSKSTTSESRIYQETLFPTKLGERFYLNHRFRYEQRFVEGQDFRTRFRYNLFLNVAINRKEMTKGTLYLALYDEVFLNGEQNIGNGRTVETFDRNRFYGALGYVLKNGLKIQLGAMHQTTDSWEKTQVQLSLHHRL